MNDHPFSPAVRRLVDTALASVDHVEILFRVWHHGETSASWLASDTHLGVAEVATVLRDLERSGLVTSRDSVYAISSSERIRAAVAELVAAYSSRPVTLFRAIQDRSSPVRSFAQAFRLRRRD